MMDMMSPVRLSDASYAKEDSRDWLCKDCDHYWIEKFAVDCPECESEELAYAPESRRKK